MFGRVLSCRVEPVHAALVVILIGTILNVVFAEANRTGLAFIGDPHDLHADLVELALAFPPFADPNPDDWPYEYLKFARQNNYHSVDLSHGAPVDVSWWSPIYSLSPDPWLHDPPFCQRPIDLAQVFTALHNTPLVSLISTVDKRALLAIGPVALVTVFFMLALVGLARVCVTLATANSQRILAFVALPFSLPFLSILQRGNQGALFAGLAIIFFLYCVSLGRRHLPAAILLAVALNFRPNAAFLLPLFFCFGARRGFVGVGVCLAGAALIFLSTVGTLKLLYPGYTLGAWTRALEFYYHRYAIDAVGNAGNNSLYGAAKILYLYFMQAAWQDHERLLGRMNTICTLLGAALAVLAIIAFWLRRLSSMQFAFVILSSYVLASTVIGIYHLFPFAAIVLLYGRPERGASLSALDYVALGASTFVLIPKAYITFEDVGPDVVANPAVLLVATISILLVALIRNDGSVAARVQFTPTPA
jgi:hypothetical protein